ncbi:hypothetical protein JZU71_01910, partial [bacterium]|nr:hypothetical protein [bacterium]
TIVEIHVPRVVRIVCVGGRRPIVGRVTRPLDGLAAKVKRSFTSVRFTHIHSMPIPLSGL